MNQMTPIAAGIASLGRGNDKMLVHMTPGEVQGLQSLAMAHGGSLTINPQTGLPEAGFLSSILPMVAGAALAPFTGPMGAALIMGGLGTIATGSLGKGLMMGLGAYGGAGLGSAFSAAGAAEGNALASSELATASNAATEAGTAASDQITRLANAPIEGAVRPSDFVQNPYTSEGIAYMQSQGMPVEQIAQSAKDVGVNLPSISAPRPLDFVQNPYTPEGIAYMRSQGMPLEQIAQSAKEYAADAYKFSGYTPTTQAALNRGPFGNAIKGVSDVFSGGPVGDQARNAFMQNVGGMKGLAISGGAVAAPMLMAGLQPKPLQTPPKTPTTYAKYGYNQVRNPLWGQPGQPYFTQGYSSPTFTTDPRGVMGAKAGGIMALADGGYVPESGRFRIPGPGKEGDDSYIPATRIKNFPGAPDENDSRFKNLSLAQLKILAGRVKEPSEFGEIVTEIQKREDQSVPGRKVLDTETFMAADGGPVPAPQMPISPLFQQTQTAPAGDLNNYLAQLGQQVMGGVTPRAQLQGIGAINPAAIIPDPAQPAQTTSDVTKQYLYNPATQTFGLNPNYAAPVEPVVENNNDNNNDDYDGGDAAGGPIKARYAAGGLGSLPEYAAGGRLLNGPGDGVSDSIPAVIKGPKPQRAALADGEFVIPARIVSELGNGSTKAGAKRLYAMMERVQRARRKTTGKNKVAVDNKPDKLLPA